MLAIQRAASVDEDDRRKGGIHILRGEGHIAGHNIVLEAVRSVDAVVAAVQPANEHIACDCRDARDVSGSHGLAVLHLNRGGVAAHGALGVVANIKGHIVGLDRPLRGELRHRAACAELEVCVAPASERVAGTGRVSDAGDCGIRLAGDVLGAVAVDVRTASVIEDCDSLGQIVTILILCGKGHSGSADIILDACVIALAIGVLPANEEVVVRSREGALIQQVDLAVLIDDLLDRAARASASLKGDGDIRGRRFRNLIAGLDLRVVRGGQLDRTVRQDHSARGNLDVLLGVGLCGIGIGAGHGRFVIRLDLDAAVILGAFQTIFVVRRDDDIVLIMRSFQLTVLTGQFDRTIRIDLGPDRRQGHVAVRGDLSSSLIGLIARLPIQELVAAVGKGVLGQCLGSITGNGVDLDFLAAAVVRLVGQNHSGFGIVGVAVLILDVRIGAIGAGNGDRVVRLAVVIRIRQVDDDGAIGLEDAAVRQSDLAVRGDDAAASGDLDVAGGVVAGHRIAVAVGRHVVTSSVGVTILTGDRDRAVSVGLVPLRVEGLIHIGRYFDHGVGSLEVAGAVGRSIPTAEGPTGHSEGICRSQVLREGLRVVGTHGVLDLVCLSGAIVRQVDEFCAVLEGSRLGPLSVERYTLARDTGDLSAFPISGAVDTVLSRVPAGEGFTILLEGVLDGVDGFSALDDHDHIIAGAAVGLVDHGDITVRRCAGELIAGVDRTAVIGQNDRAVRLDDRSVGDLDILAARIEIGGILGTVDRAAVAVLHLDAAIRLRGELTAIVGISGSHGDIVLRMVGAGSGVCAIQNAVLTGKLDRAIRVDFCPLCVEDLTICDILNSRFSGIFLGTSLSHPVQEDVSCPGKGILDGRNSVAFNDLDQDFIVLAIVDVVNQRKDFLVLGLAILIGDVGIGSILTGNGDGAVALAVLVRIRAVDDDRTVRQELAAVRHTDHRAARQSHAATLGDLNLALIVAAGFISAVAIAGGVGVRIIGITIGAGNGDGVICVRLEPLCEQSLVDLVRERQDVAGLIERSTAVGGLIPTTKRPAGHLEGTVLQLALQDGVGCVAHELSILVGRAVIGLVDDVGGIPILRIPHCIEREICRNRSILGVGLAVAAAAVIPASEAAVAGISEQAAADLELALLADLLLHFLIAVVGIIGDRNIAVGEVFGDLVIGADLTAIGVRQNNSAVRLHNRATRDDNVFLTLVRLIRVRGTGHGARSVVGDRDAALYGVRTGVERGRGIGIGGLDDDVIAVTDLVVLARQDNRVIRAGIDEIQIDILRHVYRDAVLRIVQSAIFAQLILRDNIALKGVGNDRCVLTLGHDLRAVIRQRIAIVLSLDRNLRLVISDDIFDLVIRKRDRAVCLGI